MLIKAKSTINDKIKTPEAYWVRASLPSELQYQTYLKYILITFYSLILFFNRLRYYKLGWYNRWALFILVAIK